MRRFRSRFRSTRRYSRRRFRTTRVQRSRRIFRKFIRRAALKPEFKWAVSDSNGSIAANGTFTSTCSVGGLAQGTSVNQRIGQAVRFVKVDVTINIKNDSATLAASPQIQSAQTRVVVWSPRIDIGSAGAYMNSIGYLTHVDFAQVTVYRDFMVNLSPPYMREAVNNDIAGGPYPYEVTRKMSIKFPRKVKFASANNTTDEEKARLYISLYNSALSTTFYCVSKTWFLDT